MNSRLVCFQYCSALHGLYSLVMEVNRFNKYFLLYFLTAQTLCAPKTLKANHSKWIPLMVHLIITTICTYIIISERWYVNKTLTDWILDIFKLNLVLPSVLIIFSNISARGNSQTIPSILLTLISSIEQHFGVNFSAGKLLRSHNYYIFVRISLHLITSVNRELILLFGCSIITGRIITTIKLFNSMFELYFLLHVDLMHAALKFLNANLQHHSKSTKIDGNRRFHILNYVSYVYCNIWVIKNDVERRFGWTLMAVFLDKYIQFTIHPYDMFQLIGRKASVLQIMRK